METESPFELMRSLQSELTARLRAVDLDSLSRAERDLVHDLRGDIVGVKADLRDWAAAETGDETKEAVAAIRERLNALNGRLVEAGHTGILGAADVAITSAYAAQLLAKL